MPVDRGRFISSSYRVAVLYQALDPPTINGVRKPKKPGGYQDSGADIAFVLRQKCNVSVVTPHEQPDPTSHEGWCFPDTEDGIVAAVQAGANCIWANTILFARHPLQISTRLDQYLHVRVVGQPPRLIEAYDDKNLVNTFLRKCGGFTMPRSCVPSDSREIQRLLQEHDLSLPIVAKPIRGRGSQGVKVCRSMEDLASHVDSLGQNNALLEEFLSGSEGTVTVMPPSKDDLDYWAMPVVLRFNHADDIAPYSGAVAVSANSRVVPPEESKKDRSLVRVARECERAAKLLRVKAPVRIDVRKANDEPGSPFVLFDVNMKPNMTAPGRPGREDQASLTALAAAGLGWSPAELLRRILVTSSTLGDMRAITLPEEVEA